MNLFFLTLRFPISVETRKIRQKTARAIAENGLPGRYGLVRSNAANPRISATRAGRTSG